MHPGTQELWLLGSVCASSCWQDSRPLTRGGGQMRSPSPYPISSSHHHQHTHHSPQPLPLPPLAFRGVWWLWPLLSCPSLHRGGEEGRGRKREAAAHYHHVPRGPLPACLPAPPAAQYSCGSVPDPDQLGSQPCQRATRRATVCESSLSLFARLFIRWTTQTLTPTTAAKPLRWCWEDPLLSMAVAPWALALPLPLVLTLLSLAPAPTLGGCPAACRCSFAMLQCLEPDGITSIPALAPQESENVTEMWVWCVTCSACVSKWAWVYQMVLTCLDVGGSPSLILYVCVQLIALGWCWIHLECLHGEVLVLMGPFGTGFISDLKFQIWEMFADNSGFCPVVWESLLIIEITQQSLVWFSDWVIQKHQKYPMDEGGPVTLTLSFKVVEQSCFPLLWLKCCSAC